MMSQNEEVANNLLATWFHVGEEVVIPHSGHPPGSLATVLGFGERHIGRGGFKHNLAGIYIDFMNVRVAPKGGGGSMKIVDASAIKRPHSPVLNHENHCEGMRGLDIRIGDLPDTPFWVGDVVCSSNDHRPKDSIPCYIVSEIDYSLPAMVGGIGYYLVSLENRLSKNLSSGEALALVSRGNIWKLEHGEKLSFASLDEEARFYQSLGMSHKVTHPRGGPWPLGAAIQKLQDGSADQIIVKNKKTQDVVIIKYENAEFSERMRKAELTRLGFDTQDIPHDISMGE